MRIVHDWPKLLPSLAKPQAEVSAEGLRGLPAPSPAEHLLHAAQVTQLRSNPLWRPDLSTADQIAALPAWLEHHWLGMPVATWLQRRFEPLMTLYLTDSMPPDEIDRACASGADRGEVLQLDRHDVAGLPVV